MLLDGDMNAFLWCTETRIVVLITGATGFVGRHLEAALVACGHEVVSAGRSISRVASQHIFVDFTKPESIEFWASRLANVDVAVNAAGILRETAVQTFDLLHVRAPKPLFAGCATRGVKVVQISALGAHADATTAYFRTKAKADDYLLRLKTRSVVVQPALVYGNDGASGKLFTTLAALPVIPIPGPGTVYIQPIHIDDLTTALVKLVETDAFLGTKVPLAGPQAVSLKEFLSGLRKQMGLPAPLFVRIPQTVAKGAARMAEMIPGSLLDSDTLAMLAEGNTGDPAPARSLAGPVLRPPSAFIDAVARPLVKQAATLRWCVPLLRVTMALIWIVTGIVSITVYPREESYALLARVGLTDLPAIVALYGAATLDLVLGVASLVLKRRRAIWALQAAVIVTYTALITVALPEQWAHPFGPILKNFLLLAVLAILFQLDEPADDANRRNA